MTVTVCRHCSNPDKESWQTSCLWFGQQTEKIRAEHGYLAAEDFLRSGWDPPCCGDAYAEEQDRRDRQTAITATLVIGAIVAAAIAVGLFF